MRTNSRPEILRKSPALRNLVREHHLRPEDLVLPVFLNSQKKGHVELKSLPGVSQWSVEASLPFVETQVAAGIRSIILFGIVEKAEKTADGRAAWDAEGPVAQALRRYRQAFGDVVLFADACFCEYTDHGHCGPLSGVPSAQVARHQAQTLEGLGRMAQVYAAAGADVIAPSGMVDDMVAQIRSKLDAAQFTDRAICSYAVKYASHFYGPFREAAENAPSHGDRRSYQMDVANRREALREIDLDVREGADMLLIKPGMPCLDIVRDAADRTHLPIGTYQVSGEYSMIKAAGRAGWINEEAVFLESLTAMKRAGAQFMITYWAPEAARLLKEGRI
ncbi:MAG: porphobilinogen synthase [Bdellovibrionales bacterium]|nr:porphobilinogen synthase [Bdellovibrionales bacterium]